MKNGELTAFITHARKKGMDHATIRMLLLSSGWKERDIAEGLSAEGLDMAVPTPPDTGSARDAFFHLLAFASLYTVIISLVVLFFQYIERAFPDAALEGYYVGSDYGFSSIRWSIAAIIVAFPLLLWMSRLIHREMIRHPEKSWGGVRRWLTYLTLFVAASALMVDVITLIFSLLEGELSVRFLLKVLTVFVIAGLTFTYYFLSMKLKPGDSRKLNRVFLVVSTAVTVLAIVWGVVIVGSPGNERLRKFDERRIEDLRVIHNEIQNIAYGVEAEKPYPVPPLDRPIHPVPQTLEEVRANAVYQIPDIVDPETGSPYEYTAKTATAYSICATFSFPREERFDILWNHPAGTHCFELDVLNRQ